MRIALVLILCITGCSSVISTAETPTPTAEQWEKWLVDNAGNQELSSILIQFEPLEYGERKTLIDRTCFYVAKRCAQAKRPLSLDSIKAELRWSKLRNAVANARTQYIMATNKTCDAVTLVKVLTGNTIQVRKSDGSEETVRLLCLDATPDNTSTQILQHILATRKQPDIRLEYDDAFPQRDSNGHLQAWVWNGPYLTTQEMIRCGAGKPATKEGRGRHGANLNLLE